MERTGKIFVNYLETTSNWNGQYPQTIVALPQWFDFLLPTIQYTITGSGRSLGEGNGNTLQYSCLGNPMDRGAWWATFHGVTRVGHDSMTKPPPDTIQGKCFTYVNCLWESVGFFFSPESWFPDNFIKAYWSSSLEKSKSWSEKGPCWPGLVLALVIKMTKGFFCISKNRLQTFQGDISTHHQLGHKDWKGQLGKSLETADGPAIGTAQVS